MVTENKMIVARDWELLPGNGEMSVKGINFHLKMNKSQRPNIQHDGYS